MPGRGPCPNVGITAMAVPAQHDDGSPSREQRLSVMQVEVAMGRMYFVAGVVITGKVNAAKCRESVRRSAALDDPLLEERRVDGQPVKVRLNEDQHHDRNHENASQNPGIPIYSPS